MIPGSDTTTWSLAMDVEEECADSNVIFNCSSLVKGTLERIMRHFFALILYFENVCLEKNVIWSCESCCLSWVLWGFFGFFLVGFLFVCLGWVFSSSAINDGSTVGSGILAALFFFSFFPSSQKMEFHNAFASLCFNKRNCRRARNAKFKDLSRPLWSIKCHTWGSSDRNTKKFFLFCSVQQKKGRY